MKTPAHRSDTPNVLLILTDMQRADTIHALGNPVIRTPNLDRLAAEGTAFTNCFSPSPVCVPARCSMHYGLYPQKLNLFDNGKMPQDNGRSIPGILAAAGYRTHAVGKCHFTPDHRALRGFQTRRTQEECTSNPAGDDYVAWLRDQGFDFYEPHGARGEMYYIPQVSCLPASAHPTQWIGDESCSFLRGAASEGKPWMLFSSFIHPHPPFAPPKPWHKLYRPPQMPLPFVPQNSADLQTWINRFQNRYKWRDRGIDVNLVRTITAYYYAVISFVDFQIGRMLAALAETGQLDNTLVIFTSDHGEYLGDYGCFGKRAMHNASSRIPMLVRLPGVFPAGHSCATAVSLVDVLPTIACAAGIPADRAPADGGDMRRIAETADTDRTVYSQFCDGATAIYMAVNRKWKYVHSAGDRADFLFDRVRDPAESVNVFAENNARDAAETMKQDLLKFLASNGRREAYVESGARLDWKEYPRVDEKYLQDPDARLLFQDYPAHPLNLPGYASPQ